jgi:nitroreductase
LPDPDTAAAFARILEQRKSIRIFGPDPLPEHVVRQALEQAMISPNSSNLQLWRFYRIRKPDDAVKKCFLNQAAARSCQELIVAVARPDLWKHSNDAMLEFVTTKNPPHAKSLIDYHTKKIPFMYAGGFLGLGRYGKQFINWIAGFATPVSRHGFTHRGLREIAVKSTALACQTFMLAIAAQGYDTCPMEGYDHHRLKKLLKLPRRAALVMGIAVGKRSPAYTPNVRFRLPYTDVVTDF